MDHSYYKDRVSAWIDQELPPYEQEALTRHIAECEECQALAEKLRQAYRLVDEHSEIRGSDEYWEELARKTEARIGINQADNITEVSKARTSKSSGLVWKIAAVAASLVALTFIGLHRQDILQDIFNQEAAPTEVQRPATTPARTDTAAVGGQAEEGTTEAVTDTERKETAVKQETPSEAAGTIQEAEPQISTSTEGPPAIKRSATPPPTSASDEEAAKVAVPAPVPEQPKVEQTPAKTTTEEPKTSSEGYINELKDHLGEALKPQTQSLAAPSAPRPSDSVTSESDRIDQLAHWRGLRDSLLAIYPLEESKGVRKGKQTRQGGTTAADRPDSLIADCLFNLAKNTDNSSEFDQCIRQLTVLRKSSKDSVVARYLDSALKLKQK